MKQDRDSSIEETLFFVLGDVGNGQRFLVRHGRQRSRPIKHLIGSVRVRDISAETIKKYRQKRTAEGIAGRTVNMEVTLLRLILKKAKRWARMSDEVRNLRESRDIIGRVLTQEEKVRLFQTARSQPDWYRAHYCGVIAVNTTGRKIEVLRSRLRDVDFFRKAWTITRSKPPRQESVRSISTKKPCKPSPH